jgi:hypothetical protein
MHVRQFKYLDRNSGIARKKRNAARRLKEEQAKVAIDVLFIGQFVISAAVVKG